MSMNQSVNEEIITSEAVVCATCERPLHGPYCSHCGEKKLDEHDKRVVHIFEEFFHSLTHADSKFLRSMKYLLTRPGFLTNEYLAGRRKRYSSPLSLFFIANLIYLFAAPFDTFNSHFKTVTQGQPYSQYLIPQVKQKMEAKHWTIEQLEQRYDEKSSHEAKLLLILFVFLVSLPAALIFMSGKRYYYDYVIFAMEYVNFIMYGLMLMLPWLLVIAVLFIRRSTNPAKVDASLNADTTLWVLYSVTLVLLWGYLTIAAGRVFKQNWWVTLVKAAALTFCTLLAMFFYRFVAFEVTMFFL